MTLAQVAPLPAARRSAASAVAWIDDRTALVAAMSHEGNVSTCEFARGQLPEAAYLAQVVRLIGDRERVVILGSGPLRLALEREYVAIFQRPERFVDAERLREPALRDLTERVRALGAPLA